MSAARISRSPLRVSKSGSPGPAPTSHTSPGWMGLSDGMADHFRRFQELGDGRAAGPAIRPGFQASSYRVDARQRFAGDRRPERIPSDIEADADDRAAIGGGLLVADLQSTRLNYIH